MSARFVTGETGEEEAPSSRRSSRSSWNTIKPRPKGGRPYATSLSFAFALTAIMTALVLVAVLSVVWEGQFMAYTRSNMQSIADSTAAAISDAYRREGELNDEVASYAESASSLSPDIVVQVTSEDGTVLYDDTWARADATNPGLPGTRTPATVPAGQGAPSARTSPPQMAI